MGLVTTTSLNEPPMVSNTIQASSGLMSRRATLALAMLLGVATAVPVILPLIALPVIARVLPRPTPEAHGTLRAAISHDGRAPDELAPTARFVRFARQILAQDQQDQDEDENSGDSTVNKGASSDEIKKYVAVYRAMQHNHSMTIEEAAAGQGMNVGAFRDLERRIESDDLARDEARRALAGETTSTATPKAR
jgi:hypothetical protein